MVTIDNIETAGGEERRGEKRFHGPDADRGLRFEGL
jgi:hypothetical protein